MAFNFSLEMVYSVALILLAPILGGILSGLDRKITAGMQSRVGPPILQPFYDFIKLWGKEPFIANRFQPMLAFGYFAFAMTGIALLAFKGDLVHIIFTITLADMCLIIAAFNSMSPYSSLGARRELLAVLSYEPIVFLTAMSVQIVTGSFLVEEIFNYGTPLLFVLPAAYLLQLLVLLIDMKKSPFDVSASGHAHQELVRGVYTEFSGYTMAMIELGHWVKVVFALSLISLFWANNLIIGAVLALILWFITILIDNVYPRLNWKSMLKTSWTLGFLLILANIVTLVIMGVI